MAIVRALLTGVDARVVDAAAVAMRNVVERSGGRVVALTPLPVRTVRGGGLTVHKRAVDLDSPSWAVLTSLQRLSLAAGVTVALSERTECEVAG